MAQLVAVDDVPVHQPIRKHRRRWGLALAVSIAAVALLLGSVAWAHRGEPGPSAPILSSTDGLPAVLEAGAPYTATLTAAVPADWAAPQLSDDRPFIFWAFIERPERAAQSILCSGTGEPDDIVTLSCPLVAPEAPGTDVTITFGRWNPVDFLSGAQGNVPESVRVYHHRVR